MSLRDEIRELCLAHDKLMAEQASEPIKRPPVSESDTDAGLVFKTVEDAMVPTAEPEPMPADSEPYPSFTDLRAGIAKFVVTWTADKLAERDRRIERLEGKLDATLQLLGARTGDVPKSGEIVELPKFLRRTTNAA